MYFAMGLFRGRNGEMNYSNLRIGGCKTQAAAHRLIVEQTGEGFIEDDHRNVVAAVGRHGIKTIEDLWKAS